MMSWVFSLTYINTLAVLAGRYYPLCVLCLCSRECMHRGWMCEDQRLSLSVFLNCSPPSKDVVCGRMKCADGRTHHSLCAEVKGQLCTASSLLRPLRGFWKLGSGCQPRVASTYTCRATLLVLGVVF